MGVVLLRAAPKSAQGRRHFLRTGRRGEGGEVGPGGRRFLYEKVRSSFPRLS